MRAAAGALAAFEVAVRRRRAALARLEPVVVHREAHRAARLAPLEAGVAEDAVEPLGFGLRLHEPGARHDHRELDVATRRAGRARPPRPARRSSMRELVHEPMNTLSIAMSVIGVLGCKPHVRQRALDAFAPRRVALLVRIGHAAVDRHDHLRRRAPRHLRRDLAPRRTRASCRTSRPRRSRACASARRRDPTARPPARTAGPRR